MSERSLTTRALRLFAIMSIAVLMTHPAFAQPVGNQSGVGSPVVAVPGPNNNAPGGSPGLGLARNTPDVPISLAPAPNAPG